MKNNHYNKIVYETPWLIEFVYRESDRVRESINDQTLLESRCIDRLGNYIKDDVGKLKNKKLLRKLVYEEVSESKERNKKNFSIVMSGLATYDENEEEVQYEPIDVLADVESEALKPESIALLAKGDRRKTIIVTSWYDGLTCDSTLARTLARIFGTSMQTQRIAIQRFRNECKEILTAAV